MGEDSDRPGRNLPIVRYLRIFVAPIIMKNVLQGRVAETLDRTIAWIKRPSIPSPYRLS